MKRQFAVQYVLTVIILFILVFFWEYYLEIKFLGIDESVEERWKYIITVIIFGMLALIIPTIISIREWNKHQRIEKKIKRFSDELKIAIEQTSRIIDYKIQSLDYDSIMANPHLEKCWEKMQCSRKECLCYGKEPMRCWQVAGTLCKNDVQGEFSEKYGTCYECEVYKGATVNPDLALKEHLNNMIHVLELQNRELAEALNEIKTLRGIIPICSYCKKIRNDQGAWNIMEEYITEHSNAQFSHGLCPDCFEKQVKEIEEEY